MDTAYNMRGRGFVWLQTLGIVVVGALALALAAFTIAGALGLVPTIRVPLQFGDTLVADAGLWVQAALAIVLGAVATAMPSGLKVLGLERSHRDFQITMSDVADAYYLCHAADRADTFDLSSEFDAVKERINFLRQHPDLGSMEPAVLEAAAQMSYVSRDLAANYSDESVARARGFLRHRQEEAALFEERFEKAKAACYELRRHREEVELEEQMAESRVDQLEEEFGEMLEDLGFTRRKGKDNVVAMPSHATAAE